MLTLAQCRYDDGECIVSGPLEVRHETTVLRGLRSCAAVAVASPSLLADVKTREKTTFSLEGVLGGVVRIFGGRAAREGVESTVAVKGNRKISLNSSDRAHRRSRRAEGLRPRREAQGVHGGDLRRPARAVREGQGRGPEAGRQRAAGREGADGRVRQKLEFDFKVDETGQKKSHRRLRDSRSHPHQSPGAKRAKHSRKAAASC